MAGFYTALISASPTIHWPAFLPPGRLMGRLVLTLISVQQQHVQAMMEDRLGDRYLRLDADWPPDACLGIDVATPQAVDMLSALARKTLHAVDPQRLAAFLP